MPVLSIMKGPSQLQINDEKQEQELRLIELLEPDFKAESDEGEANEEGYASEEEEQAG
eukprot:CAMPEP_0170474708 /NCGR_PEP_ID=MMETSP0123-20130129/16448_1 /TAXON_ID=182087 /ORGANISM="Favella ehrenbergii, Strain Fehren 1" /LENGTH=57 /DNA_ID=CAMNT_0010744667 /DNA_START=429 /DNA_END=598 /DNA_ORIENTATION=-